jgi:hypothetical protein
MQSSSRFVVHGLHITENLLHHKSSDVRRILEEKGYKESSDAPDNATLFQPVSGEAQDGKQTVISFDDSGFVLQDGGVELVG